jgi:hypothetical protein
LLIGMSFTGLSSPEALHEVANREAQTTGKLESKSNLI